MAENVNTKFWETKKLTEMSEEEWESLCDGCGKCCFLRYEESRTVHYTRICCDFLDTKTGACTCYEGRFKMQPKCCVLESSDAVYISRMPESCAYRRIQEGKPLLEWHPLICGNKSHVPHIRNAVHEKEVIGRETEFDIEKSDYEN